MLSTNHLRPVVATSLTWAIAGILLVAPSASAWEQSVPPGDDPVVADGRVWWLTATAEQGRAGPTMLQSRPLAGGDLQSRSIALPPREALPPGDGGLRPAGDGVVVSARLTGFVDDRAYLEVQACGPAPQVQCGGVARQIVDTTSGRQVELQSPAPTATSTSDSRVLLDGGQAGGRRILLDPENRRPVGVAPDPAKGPTQINGRYASQMTGADRWTDEQIEGPQRHAARLRVFDLRTGRQRFSVGIKKVALRSASRGVQVQDVRLQDDGSVAVETGRGPLAGDGRAGRGSFAPVFVDRRGGVRRLGPAVRDVSGVRGLLAHGRGLVGVSDNRPPSRSCDADVWITDGSGIRFRRVRDGLSHTGWPLLWDGRYAVWGLQSRARRTGTSYVAVTSGIDRGGLSRHDRPTCKARR